MIVKNHAERAWTEQLLAKANAASQKLIDQSMTTGSQMPPAPLDGVRTYARSTFSEMTHPVYRRTGAA